MSEIRKMMRELILLVHDNNLDSLIDGKSDFTQVVILATKIIKKIEKNEKLIKLLKDADLKKLHNKLETIKNYQHVLNMEAYIEQKDTEDLQKIIELLSEEK